MKKIYFLSILLMTVHLFSQDFWIQTNGPYGGSPQNLVMQSNGNIYCATSMGGGIYKSTNNGNTWEKKYNPIPPGDVMAITADANNNLYAGSNSFMKSTDNGNTWIPFTGYTYANVYNAAVNSSGHIFVTSAISVYRSTNNGVNWVWIGGTSGYTAQYLVIDKNDYIYYGLGGGWINKSTNNGNNWIYIPLTGGGIGMAIDSSGNLLVANYFGIHKSTNGGSSWQTICSGANFCSVSAVSNNEIYAGSAYSQIYKSSNNGLTWNEVYNAPAFGLVKKIIRLSNGSILAANWYGGLLISSNGGINWTSANSGITNQRTTDIIYNGNAKLYCGTYYDGLYMTSNRGDSWTQIGLEHKYVGPIGAIGDNHIFAYIVDMGQIYWTTNAGLNWQLNDSMQFYGLSNFLTIDSILFAGSVHGVQRTTDFGLNWSTVGFSNSKINKLDKDSSKNIYAATDTAIYRSSDLGNSWTRIIEFPALGILLMTVSLSNNYIYVLSGTDLYRSTNRGVNWSIVSSSIYFKHILCNNEGTVFGLDYGLFYKSTDFGVSWEQINSGLFNTFTNDLAIDDDDYLYISTSGSGIFRSRVRTVSIKQINYYIPKHFFLYQNYPNPFNPVTKVKFDIPPSKGARGMITTLAIYDVLGREVAVLVNEQLSPGPYAVTWDASAYPSGVYFYKLVTQDFSETKKMILIK